MAFRMDDNGNWIDNFTGTRFNIYHFDINGINEFTGTKRDEEGYNVKGEDKYGHDRKYNKDIEQKLKMQHFMENQKKLEEKYLNMLFDFKFFKNDLKNNKQLIIEAIEQMAEKSSALFDFYIKNINKLNSKETELLTNHLNNNISPGIDETLKDPYFFFCTDDNLTYISNKNINVHNGEKVIMPFTSARASRLRFYNSGNNKYQITFSNGEISSIKQFDSKKETHTSINDINVKPIDEIINDKKQITGEAKKSGVGDISKLMKSEQDAIMSAPAKGVTLISGVAGSGKTNILLHRIQFLLWEQPGKKNENDIIYHQNNIIFLCFNKALQKYIESSIANKFPSIQVKTIDQWGLDIFKEYFPMISVKLDEDVDFSIDNSKNIINKFLSNITDKNIGNYYIEKNWYTYEFKEGKNKKTQGNATIDLNPSIIHELFNKISPFTKKHLITRLYLLSITNIKQDSANTFCITIGDKKFNNLKTKGRNNDNIDYLFSKPLYDHIFIDEIQDLTKAQIQIVNGFHNNSMTIAGDESQLLTAGTLGSELSEIFGIKISQKYDLKTSHRNSQQTALFANEFLKKVKYKNEIQFISFKGLQPLVKNVNNSIGELEYLIEKINDLKTHEPNASICVVFPKKNDANNCVNYLQNKGIDCYLANSGSRDFGKTIHITNYHQAKGLEFDYVFICGINDFDTRTIKNKNNIIYTLITRGIKRVYITIQSQLPKLFNGIDTKTYIIQ